MSCNRTKHIKLRYFHIRELIENGEFEVKYVSGDENVADLFTKSLGRNKFEYFVKKLFGSNN